MKRSTLPKTSGFLSPCDRIDRGEIAEDAGKKSVPVDDDLRQVLEICMGDYKDALRMVLVANAFYEAEIERLKAESSSGYRRGQVRKPAKKKLAS